MVSEREIQRELKLLENMDKVVSVNKVVYIMVLASITLMALI